MPRFAGLVVFVAALLAACGASSPSPTPLALIAVAVKLLRQQGAGLEVISVADPTIPQAVASLPIPGGAHNITVAGSLAMVTNAGGREGGLWVIDLRRPSQPQVVGGTSLPAAGMRVAAGNEYGLVGSPAAGVSLWRFANE